jgi:paraquat-inducible protein B
VTLNATLEEASRALGAVRELADSDGMKQLPHRLDAVLTDLSATLEGMSAESDLYIELSRTIKELNRTLQGVQGVTNALEDKPSSLIFSSPQGPDPEPRATP